MTAPSRFVLGALSALAILKVVGCLAAHVFMLLLAWGFADRGDPIAIIAGYICYLAATGYLLWAADIATRGSRRRAPNPSRLSDI